MAITRVSTYNTHLIAIDTLQQKQASIADTQNKISSGVKYETLAEIAKDGLTRRVVDFSSGLNQISTYQRNNTLQKTRLELMDGAVDGMEQMMDEAIQAITQERSSSGSSLQLEQQLTSILEQMQDRLNVNSGGRYLFSGSKTTTRPVESITYSNVQSDGTVTDNYYRGDNTDLVHQASEDVSITTTIRANDDAFKNMIAALHMAIDAEQSGSDEKLASSLDAANEALQGLSGVRNTIRNNLSTLERVDKQHNDLKTYYNQTVGELMSTDVAEASIELSLDEAILTASFQVFARVSNLTLSNYLK